MPDEPKTAEEIIARAKAAHAKFFPPPPPKPTPKIPPPKPRRIGRPPKTVEIKQAHDPASINVEGLPWIASVREIMEPILRRCGVHGWDFMNTAGNRSRDVVRCRREVCYHLALKTDLTYQDIGKLLKLDFAAVRRGIIFLDMHYGTNVHDIRRKRAKNHNASTAP